MGIAVVDMSLEGLISKVRELFVSLEEDEVRELTREDFAEALGVDPLNIPSSYKKELARVLYYEFNVPYRKICELLAMSMRDVSKAVRGGSSGAKAASKRGRAVEADIELQVKAIELIRSGEARNPNDLVLKLRIPLDTAEKLFSRIVDNEGIAITSTIQAARELRNLVEEVEMYREEFEELLENLKKAGAELRELLSKAEDLVKKLKGFSSGLESLANLVNRVEQLEKECNVTQKRLSSLITTVGQLSNSVSQLSNSITQLERALMNRVTQLKQRFNELNERFKKVREALEFMEIGLSRRFVFREWRCAYIDDRGYCKFVAPITKPLEAESSGVRLVQDINGAIGYRVNVEIHKFVCAACPFYRPRGT